MIPLIISNIENQVDYDFIEDIYNSYNRLMYSEIVKITKDNWAADDILQSVIVKLIGKVQLLHTLNKPRLINYIVAASRNTAYNYMRKRNKISEVSFDDEILSNETKQGEIFDGLLLQESIETVHIAWKALDERYRRVLEMRYFLDNTDVEISAELGIRKNSVRMVLTRARNSLKNEIEKLK